MGLGRRDSTLHARPVGDVGGGRKGLSAGRFDVLDYGVQFDLVARHQGDLCPFARQPLGDLPAEASSRAGDDPDLSRKLSCHGFPHLIFVIV